MAPIVKSGIGRVKKRPRAFLGAGTLCCRGSQQQVVVVPQLLAQPQPFPLPQQARIRIRMMIHQQFPPPKKPLLLQHI